jgi:hypothetical protein
VLGHDAETALELQAVLADSVAMLGEHPFVDHLRSLRAPDAVVATAT